MCKTEMRKNQKKMSKIPFENAYVEDCYKFIVTHGNNSGLIRKAMQRRSWWIEIQPVHTLFNFKWQPCSNGINYNRLGYQVEQNNISNNQSAAFGPPV